jgi:hypothetical protein
MKLVGADGNAFAIMGRFQGAARRAGWSQEEISAVLKEAQSGDYDHLLVTIANHVKEPFEEDEDEDE